MNQVKFWIVTLPHILQNWKKILLKNYGKRAIKMFLKEAHLNPKLFKKSFKNREIGIYEVADRLHGHYLYEFSNQITIK